MHYTSNIAKIIFDPEVYMSILAEIIKITKVKSIDMYTVFLLNSVYVNEMLDEDLKWKDRSNDEFKNYINKRVKMLVKIGVDIVNATPAKPDPEIREQRGDTATGSSGIVPPGANAARESTNSLVESHNPFSHERNVRFDSGRVNSPYTSYTKNTDNENDDYTRTPCESSLFDLVDSMPVDQNDDYYKKLNKFKVSCKKPLDSENTSLSFS